MYELLKCYIFMIVIYFITGEKLWIIGINICFMTLLSILITLLLKRIMRSIMIR